MDSRYVGTSVASQNGSSNRPSNCNSFSASICSAVSTIWLVPKCRDTSAAIGDSSTLPRSKATEKVRTGSLLCRDIIATRTDESIPPDKKTPMGTSLIIWFLTAFSKRFSSSNSSGTVALGSTRGGDQYRWIFGSRAPRFQSSILPGASLLIPWNIVRGTGM